MRIIRGALGLLALSTMASAALAQPTEPILEARVSWLGNTFSGANGQWVQNFFIHMKTRPDSTCVTWSHWDEGGHRFGQYKDGKLVGNQEAGANSLLAIDKRGRKWELLVDYLTLFNVPTIPCRNTTR